MTRKQRERVAALERRALWLDGRIATYHGANDSRDRAERGAIRWALALIQAAEDLDVLDDLEQQIGPLRGVA